MESITRTIFTHDGTPVVRSGTDCPDPVPETEAPMATTPTAPAAPPPPRVTPTLVLRAFERVPLPSSSIVVQPGDGETLVNLPTTLSTRAEPFTETVSFFGGRVTVVLHIRPSAFSWNHGDGTSQTTDWPGRRYRRSDGRDFSGLITHAYLQEARDLAVSVDTTWTATWSLQGRDMGAVPGSVTMLGESESLAALQARPVLVG